MFQKSKVTKILIQYTISIIVEGQLITCSYEYISDDMNTKSFVMFTLMTNYIIPITIAIYFYSQIVMAVVNHEKALREQAKKMGVDSLRSGEAVIISLEMYLFELSLPSNIL